MRRNSFTPPTVSRVVGWIGFGLVSGAVTNFFVLRRLLQSTEWRPVFYCEAGLGLLLAALGIRNLVRRGSAPSCGLPLGVALSIAGYWALLFWVVIGFSYANAGLVHGLHLHHLY